MGNCISAKNKVDHRQNHFNEKLFKTVDYRMITSVYTITPTVLGSGNFGKVFHGYHNVNKEFQVAVKTI